MTGNVNEQLGGSNHMRHLTSNSCIFFLAPSQLLFRTSSQSFGDSGVPNFIGCSNGTAGLTPNVYICLVISLESRDSIAFPFQSPVYLIWPNIFSGNQIGKSFRFNTSNIHATFPLNCNYFASSLHFKCPIDVFIRKSYNLFI